MMTLLKPFKRELAIVAALSLITNLMALVPTIYMLQLYDRVMLSMNTLTLVAITLMVCFLLLMMALAEWLRSVVVIKSGVRFDQTYGKKIFSLAFSNMSANRAIQPSQALKDLTAVRQFMTGNGLFAFLDMPWSVLYIAVLFVLNPVLGLTAIVFCAIQFALAVLNQRSSVQPLQAVMENQTKNDRFLQNKIRSLDTAHVMGMRQALYVRWHALSSNGNRDEEHAQYVQNRNQFVNKLLRYTMQSLMLAIAAVLTVRGEISVGSMIASNVLIGRALQPFDVIVGTWRQFIQAKSAAAALGELLATSAEPSSYALIEQVAGNISLKNVGVSLEGLTTPILQNLNLKIKPGRILNIMGASGSGKTTLARALAGLLVPQQGDLRIDDTLIQNINPSMLAASVGYLPQQVALLEGTIAENIARFGTLDTAQIIAACQAVGMHETILHLPQGYDTRLDENGLPLSGGQRQLIGLARAIYKTPSIIVLDEPNANLDEFGEANLLNVLQKLKSQNKTIVVISHRSGLLKITDDLLILKNGEIAHYGPRDAGIAYLNQMQTLNLAGVV
jgi:ATP-binding cassette, subfamily C, bacterial exporter for protease/lipase